MNTIPKNARFDPSAALGSGCFINIVTGARSFGKTYAFKKYCIKKFLETGETWAYLRMFDSTLDTMLQETSEPFFSDICRNNEFPGYLLRTCGRRMEIAKNEEKPKWKTFGMFVALTTFDARKGTTTANLSTIVFDEFISERRAQGYPPNPVDKLLNLWETFDRREDRTRIFMLANAADLVNPFFKAWNICEIPKGTCRKFKVGNAHVFYQNAYSSEFKKYSDKSAIGALTAGSAYERYASSNEFKQSTGLFVAKKPKTARCYATVTFREQTFGLWRDGFCGDIFVTRKGAKDSIPVVLTKADMRPDYTLIEFHSPLLKSVVKSYRCGQLFFDSDRTREGFLDMLGLCGLR